jgi:hypothetical protein
MITCYDPELDRFTDDLVGDFDYLSAADRESWFVQQWTEIAAAMGWSEALDQTLNGLRRSRMGFADLGTAALGAFQQHVDRQREGDTKLDRARVRALVLDHFATTTPRNLWRIDTSVAPLPEGACFNLAKWHARPLTAGQDTQLQAQTRSAQSDLNVIILPHRAFLADAGPSYFADAAPEGVGTPSNGRCGWQTPLRLCLGTFPWVYGHRLQSPAPALAWKSSANHHPAHRALQLATNFWQAEGNLKQDARDVAAQWKYWRSATAGPLADIRDTALRLDKQLLRVAQGDEATHGLNGPRGFVSAAAFNYIQRRFAAFFAMRRALIRARHKLIPELRALADQSPDPCIGTRRPMLRPEVLR